MAVFYEYVLSYMVINWHLVGNIVGNKKTKHKEETEIKRRIYMKGTVEYGGRASSIKLRTQGRRKGSYIYLLILDISRWSK